MVRFSELVRAALSALVLASAMACTGTGPTHNESTQMRKIAGTVTYRERIALPADAVVKVQLVDVSRADAPAVVIGEQVLQAGGKQVPFAFEIAFDPSKIEASHSYAVQARIEEGGQLRFINDQRYPVITRGAPMEVDLVLRPVARRP